MTTPQKRRSNSLLKTLTAFILVLVVAGVVYEQIGRFRDRRRYAQIGRSIDIGGRSLNIYCSGEGTPAVVFDSGGHTAGYSWINIEPDIAKYTRACWYDRASYGWSDPGPSPRTPKAVASELHALLHAARIQPPYVLVGATVAGFHVRVYNGLYPDEVAGAVLIEASDPDAFAHSPEYMKGNLASLPSFVRKFGCLVAGPIMLNSGLLRVLGNPGSGQPFGMENLIPAQQKELSFLSKNPATVQGGEGCFLDETAIEVRAAGNFGNRPVVVLANAKPFQAPPGGKYAQASHAFNDYYFHQLQPHLAALSTRGKLVFEDNPERRDAIVRAVNNVLTDVRSSRLSQ